MWRVQKSCSTQVTQRHTVSSVISKDTGWHCNLCTATSLYSQISILVQNVLKSAKKHGNSLGPFYCSRCKWRGSVKGLYSWAYGSCRKNYVWSLVKHIPVRYKRCVRVWLSAVLITSLLTMYYDVYSTPASSELSLLNCRQRTLEPEYWHTVRSSLEHYTEYNRVSRTHSHWLRILCW